jgi:cell division septation protein DedD
MSMMLTFRAVKFAALLVSVAALGACSREQQDWRSAEASDTVEGYGEFLQRHPESELATEARTRVAQLSEDREWQQAGSADTADAYKQFLAQHPNGKWAQEARIRMENFALGREGTAAGSSVDAAVPAERLAAAPGLAASSDGAVGSGGVVGPGAGTVASSGGAVGSGGTVGSGVGPAASSGGAAASGAGAAMGSGGSAAQAFPGESARAQTSLPSAAASGSSGALAQAVGPSQTSPAISNAWRSDDGFGVQLGAFTSEIAATSEWQQLTARFSAQLRGLAPRVVSANTSTGRLFRLQALVADEAAARALCDVLKKQSQACVPVLPH